MENYSITASTRHYPEFRSRQLADIQHLRAILAAAIVKTLDETDLPDHKAAEKAGVRINDLKRLQKMKLGRFSIEKLLNILNTLCLNVDFDVIITPSGSAKHLN